MLDKLELNTMAIDLRNRLGQDEKSPVDMFSLINQVDRITFVQYPMGAHISGMCIKETDFNLIAINSIMSYGRQRFSIAHELFHLFYDEHKGFAVCAKKLDSDDEIEQQADQFASFFLAPYGALKGMALKLREGKDNLSLIDIIKLEQYFGMSHKAMLWRLIDEKVITKTEADNMSTGIIAKAKASGFDEKLYLPTDQSLQQRTYGHYILQAEKLKDMQLISMGKYEELLLDAYRYDIVYGDDELGGELLD